SARTDPVPAGLPLLEMPAAEEFGDLHGIERRTLAEIVADAPEVEAVFDRRVFTDAADEGRKVAATLDRSGVTAILALVVKHDAGSLAQDALRLLSRQLVLEFDIDRLGVTDEHRYTHAGRGDLDLGVEDLLRFDDHLPLFLRRAVVEELVDVGDDVEGDLLGELLHVLFI